MVSPNPVIRQIRRIPTLELPAPKRRARRARRWLLELFLFAAAAVAGAGLIHQHTARCAAVHAEK